MREKKQWISSQELFTAVEEMLSEGKQAAFTVTGMSMWPFLCHGRDQVILEKVRTDRLRKGEIILFGPAPGRYILHRITGLNGQRFQTTGDGSCVRDGWFPLETVKARAVRLVRNGKEIDCSSPVWKCIFRIWMGLFPVRGMILKLLRAGWKMQQRIRGIFQNVKKR